MHPLKVFIANNERLFGIFQLGVLFALIVTITVWISSYFHCLSIHFKAGHPVHIHHEDTVSVCMLYGKIYCYQSNTHPFIGSRCIVLGDLAIFTQYHRLYFRRAALKNPWAEFMGYKIHFSLSFWLVCLLELLLFIAILRLRPCYCGQLMDCRAPRNEA
jgi:hypothetical protein